MDFQPPIINLLIVAPLLITMGAGVFLMFLNIFLDEKYEHAYFWLALAAIVVALVQNVGMWGYEGATFIARGGYPMVVSDNFAVFLNGILLLTGIGTLLISRNYLQRTELERPEFYMLMLFSLSGMMMMGMANDLILIFVALELLSIPLYIMAGIAVPRADSEESAMKYFLLGAFSSGIFVYGIALIYGATATTALPAVYEALETGSFLAMAGTAFLMVGFAFKIAAVPFHMWTPDVYEGAPTAVTAFMSVGVKVAGFAALLRVFTIALPAMSDSWAGALAIIAALTLVVGNVVALMQPNIKRMLGYSSIAHAGYLLIGVAAAGQNPEAIGSVLFYLLAYLFTTLGAFGVAIALEHKLGEGIMLTDYKGLAKRSPWLAFAMLIFMLSLTGVPPTGGFSGKFYIFRSAVEADLWWLAIVAIITSVISGYYYLRVVFFMYMFDGDRKEPVYTGYALKAGLVLALIGTLWLGFFPAQWFDLAHEALIGTTQLLAGG